MSVVFINMLQINTGERGEDWMRGGGVGVGEDWEGSLVRDTRCLMIIVYAYGCRLCSNWF